MAHPPVVQDDNKARISRNVDKMVAQNATDEEIEEYLQSEGLQSRQAEPQPVTTELGAAPARPKIGHLEGLGNQAAQGLTAGFADELEGGMAAFSPSGVARAIVEGKNPLDTYREVRDARRERNEAYSDENPVKSALANVAGAIPTAAVSLPGLLGRSAIAGGAAAGAVAGLGTSEGDAMKQLKGTVHGAGFGGIFGGVAGAASRLASHLGGALLTRSGLRPRQDWGPIEGTETLARRFVRNQFDRDAVTAQDAISGLQPPSAFYHAGAQTPEIVADVGGESVKRALAGVQSMPGPIANKAKVALEERTAGQFGRITDGVKRILGVPDVDADRMVRGLVQQKKLAAEPLYKDFYAHGKIDDPMINKLLGDSDFYKAYVLGRRIALKEGVKLPKVWKVTGYKTLKSGKRKPIRELVEVPNAMVLDYVKRGLDGIIKSGFDGKGINPTLARALRGQRDQFVQRVDKLTRGKASAAWGRYASDMQAEEALEAGRNIFSQARRLSEDDVAALSDTDREMFLVGAYRAIRDRLATKKFGQNISEVLDNPDAQQQLRQIARTPEEFDEILTMMGQEQNMARTAAAVQGSRTAPLGAMQQELAGLSPDVQAMAGALGRGSPMSAMGHALRALLNRNATPGGQAAEDVGNMLLQPATPGNVQKIFQPDPKPQSVFGRLAGAGGGVLASPSLSSDPSTARQEAIAMRTAGLSDVELQQHLSQRYTPEVVQFIIAATPQRVPQQ